MDRRQEIVRFIPPDTRGIEVAPWFRPILPDDGRREPIVLDVFDQPTLIRRAEADPGIPRESIPGIGPVDLVGSACDIADLVTARFGAAARFDFVVSSHNLEHLPDPVRFLRGCEAVLADGGIVAMVVPDKRACFDAFRPHSSTGGWLQAYHEGWVRPPRWHTFDQNAAFAGLRQGDATIGAFSIDADPDAIVLLGDVAQAYRDWCAREAAGDVEYHDTHCWTFTRSSLELILTELRLIGLIGLEVIEVTEPVGCEIFVHLRKPPAPATMPAALANRRQVLLRRIAEELGYASCIGRAARQAGPGAPAAPARGPETRLMRLRRSQSLPMRLARGAYRRLGRPFRRLIG